MNFEYFNKTKDVAEIIFKRLIEKNIPIQALDKIGNSRNDCENFWNAVSRAYLGMDKAIEYRDGCWVKMNWIRNTGQLQSIVQEKMKIYLGSNKGNFD
jgi:hypothetical protein